MKMPGRKQPDSTPTGRVPTGSGVPTASDSLAPADERLATPTSDSAGTDVTGRDAATAAGTTPPPASGSTVTEPPATPAAPTTDAPPAGLTGKGKVRRTRVSGAWIAAIIAAILAVFLLIFITQNSEDVTIKFLGWDGQLPLAVAMLAASVVAVLIVAVPGSLRIGQLRRALRKNAK